MNFYIFKCWFFLIFLVNFVFIGLGRVMFLEFEVRKDYGVCVVEVFEFIVVDLVMRVKWFVVNLVIECGYLNF